MAYRSTPRVTDGRTVRRIAVSADVDPRTVRALLAGLLVRPSTADRIRCALAAMGLAHLAPKADAS